MREHGFVFVILPLSCNFVLIDKYYKNRTNFIHLCRQFCKHNISDHCDDILFLLKQRNNFVHSLLPYNSSLTIRLHIHLLILFYFQWQISEMSFLNKRMFKQKVIYILFQLAIIRIHDKIFRLLNTWQVKCVAGFTFSA